MANGWTPERRERQAELIQRWKPSERSTASGTKAGKAVVSRNTYKFGQWLRLREISSVLREQKEVSSRME